MTNFIFTKILLNSSNILKLLFYFFPIMMLCSSGYITVYITFVTIFSLYYFLYNKIKVKISLLDYLVLFFFLSSITSTLLNIKEIGGFMFLKSILDIRFAIFFFTTRLIIQLKIVDIKTLSFIALFSTIFLSLNIFSQHIIGFDIFGHPPFDGRYNGLFESEAIAGSYIQKFTLLSMLCIFFYSNNEKTKSLFLIISINFLGMGILLSLDRMPFLIYLFIIIAIILIFKKYRIAFASGIILLLLIFQFFFNNYDIVKNRYSSLINKYEILKIQNFFLKKKLDNKSNSQSDVSYSYVEDYLDIYYAAYKIFLKNPFLGTGIKSFNKQCNKLEIDNKKLICLTHPHNIYSEIIINQGILGILIFIIILTLLLKTYYSDLFLKRIVNDEFIIKTFLFIWLISELLPLRSYGSIFQTVNGSIFWFFLAIISSRLNIK